MRRRERWAVTGAAALVGLASAGLLGGSGAMSALQFRWEDVLQPALDGSTDVVVVAIDRETLQSFGDGWPWSRERMAELVDAINAAQPSAIAIDVLFADAREGDDVLAASLAAAPVVLSSALGLQVAPGELPKLVEEVAPTPELADAASAVGHTNIIGAGSGVVRDVALVAVTDRGIPRASFALAAVAIADGVSPVVTERADGVQVGTRLVPTDDGLLRVAWSGDLTAATAMSAIDVLRGDVDAAALRDRIVVVGVAEPTLGDLHQVPVDRAGSTSGVFILANAVNTITSAGYLSDASSRSEQLVALVLVLAMAAAVGWLALSLSAGVAAAEVAFVFLFAAWRFHTAGEHWNVVAPITGIVAALATGAGLRYITEIRHRRRAWNLFAAYVPKSAVAELEDPAKLRRAIEGTRLQVTVLFCDLRGFTPLASVLEPSEVRSVLDEFYEATVRLIHDAGGTVMQFVGDEVFAVWGAPLPDDDQCERAAVTAVAMQRARVQLDATLAERGLPSIGFGIGVHTGPAVAAHVGTHDRRQYSLVGTTVNVGSRLCSQATVGQVVVSENVFDVLTPSTREEFAESEAITVKGIDHPLTVYRFRSPA